MQLPTVLANLLATVVLAPPVSDPYGADQVALRRVTIEARDPDLADLSWESSVRAALAPRLAANDVIVRLSKTRPRAQQISLSFPVRVLDIINTGSGANPHVAADLHMGFGGSTGRPLSIPASHRCGTPRTS